MRKKLIFLYAILLFFGVSSSLNGADLLITKSVDNQLPVEGETLTYVVTVRNNGPADITGVVVDDLLPVGVTFISKNPSQGTYDEGFGVWDVGTLTSGQSEILTILALVDSGTGGMTITNTATVNNPYGLDPYLANNSASIAVTVQPNADLAITKVVSDLAPVEGDTITYTLTATNNGTNDAGPVTVVDQLPSGISFVSSGATQGSYDAVSGVWDIGMLSALSSEVLVITVRVDIGNIGQAIINDAMIQDAYLFDPAPGSNTDSATIVPQADRTRTDNVIVADQVPTGLEIIGCDPTQGSYDPYTGIWTIGTLREGESAILLIFARPESGTAGSLFTNTATISDACNTDPYTNNNSASVDVQVSLGLSDLTITKVVSNATPSVGDTVQYTIEVENKSI